MSSVIIKKSRGWIWYFVILFTPALVATIALIVFNLQQQLKPEQLAKARALCKERAPANYTMSYTTRVNEETKADHYWVKVRGGKVALAKYNGEPEPPARRGDR